MSSQGSPTPSMDSNASARQAELTALVYQGTDDDIVDMRLFKRTAAALGLDVSLSKKPVPGEDCAEWKPVVYHGTMTRPLAYFGTFQLKPETKELPWISDSTSGAVHPDMRTISMLFNEDLTLPKAAENFIEQSLALKEEARWERAKAVFYSIYPEDLRKQVFEVLSQMLRRDASRIIAMKTLRFENEIVFEARPKANDPWAESDSENESDVSVEAETCSEDDAVKLNKQFPEIARAYREKIALALEGFKTANEKLSKHNSFFGKDGVHNLDSYVTEQSNLWIEELKEFQEATKKCIEARLLFHHLDHAVARYEPRTGWIHVKTQLLRPGLEENKMLPKELFGIKIYPKYKIKGSVEAQNAAVDKQMAHFGRGLFDLRTGHLSTLDFYHNDLLYHEYDVRVPYANIVPAMCGTVVRSLLPEQGWKRFDIVSYPQVLPYEKLHHELKVYINLRKGKLPYSLNTTFNATLQYNNRYGCCLNCFSKDHLRVKCEQPVYAFANPVNSKDEK